MSREQEIYQFYNGKSNSFRAVQEISGVLLERKLIDFFEIYHPNKGKQKHIKQYLKYAKSFGVIGLKIRLRQKYAVNFDEIEVGEKGWRIIQNNLKSFLIKNKQEELKVDEDLDEYFKEAKEFGLRDFNIRLTKEFGSNLSDFEAVNLNKWKKNWKNLLNHVHNERTEYEINRYFTYLKSNEENYSNVDFDAETQTFLEESSTQSRLEINQKLLKKFKLSLGDVPMIKGGTSAERESNLKLKLTSFFQRYNKTQEYDEEEEIDIGSLPSIPVRSSLLQRIPVNKTIERISRNARLSMSRVSDSKKVVRIKSISNDLTIKARRISYTVNEKRRNSIIQRRVSSVKSNLHRNSSKLVRKLDLNFHSQNDIIKVPTSSFKSGDLFDYDIITLSQFDIIDIEELTKDGVLEIEKMNLKLMKRFKNDLNTFSMDKVISRLTEFYTLLKFKKSKEKITTVAKYGMIRGLKDMNEKLRVTHGYGIYIDDLIDQ